MTPEAAKELDRRCVWKWLNDVYRNPIVAFNTYSDEQLIELAHDALVLLNEQETEDIGRGRLLFLCKTCGFGFDDIFVNDESKYPLVPRYCPYCGRKVKVE